MDDTGLPHFHSETGAGGSHAGICRDNGSKGIHATEAAASRLRGMRKKFGEADASATQAHRQAAATLDFEKVNIPR